MAKDWHKLNFNVPILEQVSTEKAFLIKGVAINETTTRNNITYVADELRSSTASFKNKPILKDHKNEIDSIVGRTTENIRFNENSKSCIPYIKENMKS